MEKIGISEVKKIVIFAAHLGNAAGNAFEDGKIGVNDVSDLWQAMGALKEAAAVDFSKAMPQFKDIDAAEAKELVDALSVELMIPEKVIEQKIEQFFALALKIYEDVAATVAFAKQFK